MRKLRILLALSLLAGLFGSCGKDITPEVVDTTVSLKPGATELGADAGTIFVTVAAKQDWTLEIRYPDASAANWAIVNPGSGSGSRGDIMLQYTANESEQERSLTLVLTPRQGTAAEIGRAHV